MVDFVPLFAYNGGKFNIRIATAPAVCAPSI
nr:MAG TPA: hypothetical protein [Caudoviricetes sp.]